MPQGRFDRIIDSHPRAKLARDRVTRVLHGDTPDRIPFLDNYWGEFTDRYLADRA